MKISRSIFSTICIAVLAAFLLSPVNVLAEQETEPLAEMSYGGSAVTWMPKVQAHQFLLSVSGPDGSIFSKTFEGTGTPVFVLSELKGGMLLDGDYTYELKVIPAPSLEGKRDVSLSTNLTIPRKAMIQTGSFKVMNGTLIKPTQVENLSGTRDVLHYDDVIITGSLCIGFDCVNGESFGYCTLKLKENNLQLCFEDTSAGSFPTNDWKIQINDTTSGGASYFTLWDTDGGRRPFTIEAGAPAHSLYVEDYGRVGLGTSIPYVELHIVDGDSPTIRLDQDGSSGWVAQRWDLCGNETNFFLRDVTNGSKLCFRVQPNTPSNTLCLKSNGYVGVGTWSPGWPLEVETTGEDAAIVADRTDGATGYFSSGTSYFFAGSVTNHAVRIVANGSWKMQINTNNSLSMASGATCNTSGEWLDASSREYKTNIVNLDAGEALKTLSGLNPVKYNHKTDTTETQVGFIAEDVPDLVATKDRKTLHSMDILAVLTKVVKEQQETIKRLEKKIEKLEKK